MNIKVLAGILLLERLVSAGFIGAVFKKQWSLLKLSIEPELKSFRIVLFCLSGAIFIGNFVPILIDTLTIFANLSGRPNPSPIGVAYGISNATTSALTALLIWLMYRLASREPV